MALDIRRPLRRFSRHFIEAREAGLNEADTVLRLCKFFEDVLGYDGLTDISREAEFKNKFVDVCLKIDGRTRLLVEAKGADVYARFIKPRNLERREAQDHRQCDERCGDANCGADG